MSTVYLLHFDDRYPAGRRPQHYIGVAVDVDKRLAEHRNGNPGKGGSLTRALKAKGIGFRVAEEWHFGTADEAFEFERKLKKQRHHARHCKFCKEVGSTAIPDCPNCGGTGEYHAMEWEGGDHRTCPCATRPDLLVAIIVGNFIRRCAS